MRCNEAKPELCCMREIVVTKDGSHTVAIPEKGVTYHSVHGAVQESVHVFVEAGLRYAFERFKLPKTPVFEMGFGTGLNAFLTAVDATEKKRSVYYVAVETAPLTVEEASVLNYPDTLGHNELFRQLHRCPWHEDVRLNDFFTVKKIQTDVAAFSLSRLFNVIYYDAFAPLAQPELWAKEIFEKLFAMLNDGGVLVTYCSKGDVRRAMKAAGFAVTKLPGPPGKREMLRAEKVDHLS